MLILECTVCLLPVYPPNIKRCSYHPSLKNMKSLVNPRNKTPPTTLCRIENIEAKTLHSGLMSTSAQQKDSTPSGHDIENPLVMKSLFLDPPVFLENRLSRFSFPPIIFRRFFFSFSSANTRAVSEEVAAFLIPLPEAVLGTDVEVLLRFLESEDCLGTTKPAGSMVPGASATPSAVAFFLRFFEPGAFLRECVRPCSASFWPRAIRRCLSSFLVVRMLMMFSSV